MDFTLEHLIFPKPLIEHRDFDEMVKNRLSGKLSKYEEFILDLVNDFLRVFPDLDLSLFYNNLSTLRISHMNYFQKKLYGINGGYYTKRNKIIYDVYKTSTLRHELVHAASSLVTKNIIYSGFHQESNSFFNHSDIGEGFNEGYTSLVQMKLNSKNLPITSNINERCLAYFVDSIIPTTYKYYFGLDLSGLINSLANYNDFKEIISFILKLDFIYKEDYQFSRIKIGELVDLYYEEIIFALGTYITKLLMDIECGVTDFKSAQVSLMIVFTLIPNFFASYNANVPIPHIEKIKSHVPQLSSLSKEDISTFKLKI
jgi:hypothetical protein